jgi:hypothetical protein
MRDFAGNEIDVPAVLEAIASIDWSRTGTGAVVSPLRAALVLLDNAHRELMVESGSLPDDHPLVAIRHAVAAVATDLEVHIHGG